VPRGSDHAPVTLSAQEPDPAKLHVVAGVRLVEAALGVHQDLDEVHAVRHSRDVERLAGHVLDVGVSPADIEDLANPDRRLGPAGPEPDLARQVVRALDGQVDGVRRRQAPGLLAGFHHLGLGLIQE
jgi:hypothetical protein